MAKKNAMNSVGDTKPRTPAKRLKAEAQRCRDERGDYVRNWSENIDYRRTKDFGTEDDRNARHLPTDWTMVNTKMSQLFSQVPRVIATGKGDYKPAAEVFEEQLNYRLEKASVGTTMNEIMADVINASGIGIVKVEYRATVQKQMRPLMDMDPTIAGLRQSVQGMNTPQPMLPGMEGMMPPVEPEMEEQDVPIDRRFDVIRVSPDSFIWPLEFKRSNFNLAPFLGHDGEITFEDAIARGWVKEGDRDRVVGKERKTQDRLVRDNETGRGDRSDADIVTYTEMFYWRYLYHLDEKYFDAIGHLVFINGIDEPVINDPWKGQRFDEATGGYIGSCKFPIQVMTLHYISDEAIPPSDSSVIRPLVNGMEKTFKQIDEQREYSKPVRWVNTNRVDADILYSFMQGDWQGHIPTNGRGDDVVGEVARSNYPNEDFTFHRMYEEFVARATSVGANQAGIMSSGRRSATEAGLVQGNFVTRLAQERAMGVQFFLNIADVMAGLICLYDDFEFPMVDQTKAQRLQFWDRTKINHALAFSIRGDSTVLLDAEQRIDRIERFVNLMGKSGVMKIEPVGKEYAGLCGFDPEEVIGPPPEPAPDPANISFRFTGEDLYNPAAYGILLKTPYGLTEEEMDAAITAVNKLKLGAQEVPNPPNPITGEVTPPPFSAGEKPPQAGAMTDEKPDWETPARVNKRRDASQNGRI